MRKLTIPTETKRKKATAPKYKHDCSQCTFLGCYYYKGITYDLYYCPQSGIPTFIARYGENGNYLSGINFAISDLLNGHSNSPLAMALKTAEKKGLVKVKIEVVD